MASRGGRRGLGALGRDSLPQRGGGDRNRRRQGSSRDGGKRHRRGGPGSRQRLDGQLGHARRRGRRSGDKGGATRLRLRVPGWVRGLEEHLHSDGRRRRHLRLRRHRTVCGGVARGGGHGDRKPDGRTRPRIDALVAPICRESRLDRCSEPFLQDGRRGCSLRDARASDATCCRLSTCGRPEWSSHPSR